MNALSVPRGKTGGRIIFVVADAGFVAIFPMLHEAQGGAKLPKVLNRGDHTFPSVWYVLCVSADVLQCFGSMGTASTPTSGC